jgi:CrcB protein
MGYGAAISVFVGAGLGAWLRWWLGVGLNGLFPTLPLGTLAANLLGAFLVGVAAAFFVLKTGLAPEWRLFVITGFMGGLTTFSTFSVEVVTLLSQAQFGWALVTASVHLFGSLLLTMAGMWLTRWALA